MSLDNIANTQKRTTKLTRSLLLELIRQLIIDKRENC